MPRHDAQRQHVLDSLDGLVLQLYTLSFLLAPALVPLLCRAATHFVFYKPRDLDPTLSLRVWSLLLLLANAPSFWAHLTDRPSDPRAVVLDFVGIAYLPSRLHLVLLDTLILCLQILLTTISFEISLRLSSPDASDAIPSPSPDDRKRPTPTMIIDLRLRHIVHRLRSPAPLASATLPLPNTTPSPLAVHLRAIVRRREETRRRAEQFDETGDGGRMPGSMSAEQVG